MLYKNKFKEALLSSLTLHLFVGLLYAWALWMPLLNTLLMIQPLPFFEEVATQKLIDHKAALVPDDEEEVLFFTFIDGDTSKPLQTTPQDQDDTPHEESSKKIDSTTSHKDLAAESTGKIFLQNPTPKKIDIFSLTKKLVNGAETPAACLVQTQRDPLKEHADSFKELSYKDRIKIHLAEAWHRFVSKYEKQYAHLVPYRSVRFFYSISKHGGLADFGILQSSGNTDFDAIVRRFLAEEATPFPPIPEHLNSEVYTPHIAIDLIFPSKQA